jgi:hypothetical protein
LIALYTECGQFPDEDQYNKDVAEEHLIFRTLFKEQKERRSGRAVALADLTWDPSPADESTLQVDQAVAPGEKRHADSDVDKMNMMENLIGILQQKEMIKESIVAAQGDDTEIQKLTQTLAEIEQTLENHHQELLSLGQLKAPPSSVAASSGSRNPNQSVSATASPAAGSVSMPAVDCCSKEVTIKFS